MRMPILTALLAASGVFLTASAVKAGQWNQKTLMTFNEPVEVPGHVLEPGTYVFKVANTAADRNVVEVYNKSENHLYGIFLTIPDYRSTRRGRVIVTFAERPAGSPDAVWAWFYPGDNYGHEFVYSKSEATRLAKANNRPVASMPDEIANQPASSMNDSGVTAMKQAHVTATMPSGEESETNTVFGTAPSANH